MTDIPLIRPFRLFSARSCVPSTRRFLNAFSDHALSEDKCHGPKSRVVSMHLLRPPFLAKSSRPTTRFLGPMEALDQKPVEYPPSCDGVQRRFVISGRDLARFGAYQTALASIFGANIRANMVVVCFSYRHCCSEMTGRFCRPPQEVRDPQFFDESFDCSLSANV